MSRSYKGVKAKKNRVYSVQEVQALYDVSRNTVSNWVSAGLSPSDHRRPQLFRGAELNRFHADRRKRSRKDLRRGEFKCTGCEVAVFPDSCSVGLFGPKCENMVTASCPECGAHVFKLLNATDRDRLLECQNTNTPLTSIDEENASGQGRIGKTSAEDQENFYTGNDRIIYLWQSLEAGRYDPKTMDDHLLAIRDFEKFTQGKSFLQLSAIQVSDYRKYLLDLAKTTDGTGLSKSRVRHRASFVGSYLTWLLKQKGYRQLSKSIPDCLELPKKIQSQDLPRDPRPFVNIEVAEEMLKHMPHNGVCLRRNRAIFALAYLAGLRCDALISLRLRDVLLDEKIIVQDARYVRSKNGKSLKILWFHVPQLFGDIVTGWVACLRGLGFEDDDALFPSYQTLLRIKKPLETGHETVPVMTTSSSVKEAFAAACKDHSKKITPHSARDTLAALGEEYCRNARERIAWSRNLGHENPATTATYYAKPTDKECEDVFRQIGKPSVARDEDTELLLRYYEHDLTRGTPEFEKAEKLADARREDARRSNRSTWESDDAETTLFEQNGKLDATRCLFTICSHVAEETHHDSRTYAGNDRKVPAQSARIPKEGQRRVGSLRQSDRQESPRRSGPAKCCNERHQPQTNDRRNCIPLRIRRSSERRLTDAGEAEFFADTIGGSIFGKKGGKQTFAAFARNLGLSFQCRLWFAVAIKRYQEKYSSFSIQQFSVELAATIAV